jgi:hypothetical protein
VLHLRRALGWNLGKVMPTPKELAALTAAGVTDPAVQRYAAWRRSLLLLATAVTGLVFVLLLWDVVEDGVDELTAFGVGMEVVVTAAYAALPVACFVGATRWVRPGSGAAVLRLAWAATFLLPFVSALLPSGLLFDLQGFDVPPPTGVGGSPASAESIEQWEKVEALRELAVTFVLGGGAYLLLLPAVLSLVPGAMNGCLRVKSALPAAQLPGWILVCASPVFLLVWLVLLVIANHAAQSPLLVVGVLLWAGSPVAYALRGPVFVRSQMTDADAATIARVKRAAGLTGLAGVVLLGVFALTSEVAGLTVLGFDEDRALGPQVEELADDDDEVDLEDLTTAYARSDSLVYALDVGSWRFLVDFFAKLLVAIAVFSDLVMRATLTAWRNNRALRDGPVAAGFDASASAATDAIGTR